MVFYNIFDFLKMSSSENKIIYLKDFSRNPTGIDHNDSEFNAEAFRDIILRNYDSNPLTINLDGVLGISSAFLYHAIGKLPEFGVDTNLITIDVFDQSIIMEIHNYWKEQ